MTARHRWFDAGILEYLAGEGCGVEVKLVVAAAGEGASAASAAAAGGIPLVRVEISPRGRRRRGAAKEGDEGAGAGTSATTARRQQVVLLGSGMDARAWRLPLDGGGEQGAAAVAWFDLDSGPVCEIKRAELEAAGAELVRSRGGGGGGGGEEEKEAPKQRPRFPLKAASYALIGCDMASEEWVDKLKEAGFDPSMPALFAAEGVSFLFLPFFFHFSRSKKKKTKKVLNLALPLLSPAPSPPPLSLSSPPT